MHDMNCADGSASLFLSTCQCEHSNIESSPATLEARINGSQWGRER